MLQRRLAERQQPHLYPGQVPPRLMRHVRPAHIRGRPDRGEQILNQGPMQHFLPGDAEDHPPPPLDRSKLTSPYSRTRRALKTERRVQVLAHQAMLKLGSQGQKIGQLLAVPHHDGRLTLHGRDGRLTLHGRKV